VTVHLIHTEAKLVGWFSEAQSTDLFSHRGAIRSAIAPYALDVADRMRG
jgi:hypothetical protein